MDGGVVHEAQVTHEQTVVTGERLRVVVTVVVSSVQADAYAAASASTIRLLGIRIGERELVVGSLLLHMACPLCLADVGRRICRNLILGIRVEVIVPAGRMFVGLCTVEGQFGIDLQTVFAVGHLAPGLLEFEV